MPRGTDLSGFRDGRGSEPDESCRSPIARNTKPPTMPLTDPACAVVDARHRALDERGRIAGGLGGALGEVPHLVRDAGKALARFAGGIQSEEICLEALVSPSQKS